MPVGVTLEFTGATKAQYDQVLQLMGLAHRGAGPRGILFHWATSDDDRLLVTDVWQDRDRFEEFSREEIGPYSQQAGITEPPKAAFYDVHNYLTAGRLADDFTPVAVVMDFDGTTEQYDEIIGLMGFTPGGTGAPGGVFHWAAMTDDGLRVTDVWQDRQAFDAFSEGQIQPNSAKVGAPPPKSTTFYDVYNYFTANI